MSILRKWILDLLFPRKCLGCKILLSGDDNSYICEACLAGIKMKNDFACAFCDSPVIAGATCPFCKIDHCLDRLLVAAPYRNPLVEKIIKTMKYQFVGSLAEDMAGFMIKYLQRRFSSGLNLDPVRGRASNGIDRNSTIVLAVPLHRRRLNWRGFNQAEIIGRRIAEFFGWPFVADALERVRNAKPQVEMPDRKSRIANAKNIFEFNSPKYGNPVSIVGGKTVLLIDDVATTASTLDDCARALKGAGAKEIIGLVFARGSLKTDKLLTSSGKKI
jgi:ComF family protein